jgi:glycosyltransferase involved in cell wall biosynthesis
MKIWFAAAISYDANGGVARSVRELSGVLRDRNHKVKVIFAHHSFTENYILFSFKIALMLLLHLFSPPHWIIARSTDGFFALLLARLLRLRVRFAVHNHGWEQKVYELESTLPRSMISNPTTIKAHFLRFPMLMCSARLSDLCISGTIDETRWLSKKGFTKKGTLVTVPNGIHPTKQPYWPAQKELPPYFLTVGAFTWKKNLEYAISLFSEIYNHYPSARLFCVGTDSTQESIRITSNAVHAITFINKETPERIFRWYEECPILLSTSRYEGGRSFAILEAQSRGMIACAVNIPPSKEQIVHNHSGILLDGISAETDAGVVVKVLSDQNLLRQIGLNAWNKSIRCRWDRQVDRLERVLNSNSFIAGQ